MSIKIYNGYIARKTSVVEWQKRLRAANQKFQAVARDLEYAWLFRLAVSTADDIRCGEEDVADTAINQAFTQWIKIAREIKSGKDFSLWNFTSSISWVVDGKDIVCILFAHRQISKEICAFLGLEEYEYQNQTDWPDGMTTREWNSRKKRWERILTSEDPKWDFDLAPSDAMHTFEIVRGPGFPDFYADKKIPGDLPTWGDRVERLVRNTGLSEEEIAQYIPKEITFDYLETMTSGRRVSQ